MASNYFDAFMSSFSLIIVSEIGDKTFFIASLLAMQHANKIIDVFLGATSALLIMTILSTVIGTVALQLLSPKVTTLLSSIGLIYFSVTLIIKLYMNEEEEEGESELAEVEKELKELDEAESTRGQQAPISSSLLPNSSQNSSNSSSLGPNSSNSSNPDQSTPTPAEIENDPLLTSTNNRSQQKLTKGGQNKGKMDQSGPKSQNGQPADKATITWSLAWTDFDQFKTQLILYLTSHFTLLSPLFIKCCVLTFIAEWGDRSQVATILLASAKSPMLVTLGCIIGHMICTSIAISFGKILSTQLNDKHLQLVASVLFMLFGVAGLWNIFTGGLDQLPEY